MIKLQIGKVMYLNKNRLLPESVNDMFLLSQCDVHEHYVRTKNFSCLPTVGQIIERKFSYSVCKAPNYFIISELK